MDPHSLYTNSEKLISQFNCNETNISEQYSQPATVSNNNESIEHLSSSSLKVQQYNNNTNQTSSDYTSTMIYDNSTKKFVISIDQMYPLEALSGTWQIYLAVLYSLTAITSFILNVATVIVLSRIRRSELTKYLINLSVSDLLMSLFSIRKCKHYLIDDVDKSLSL